MILNKINIKLNATFAAHVCKNTHLEHALCILGWITNIVRTILKSNLKTTNFIPFLTIPSLPVTNQTSLR